MPADTRGQTVKPDAVSMSVDRRYTIVACAFVVQGVVIGSMFAYGVFFPFLEAEFAWSRTLLSAGISVAVVVMGVFAIAGGHLIDRIGPRWVLSGSGLICGIGYALMATLDAPWQLFVYFGLCVGIGMSTNDVGTLSIVARIFERRRGIMSGVVKVGTAVGQMVIPLTVTALIATFGWRNAAVALGCGVGLILLAAAQGMDPARITAGASGLGAGGGAGGSQSLGGALRSRVFWTLCAAQFSSLPALVTIPVHLPVHGVDMGMSAPAAASLLTVLGAASVAGRLGLGRTADWIGGRAAMLVCFTILAGSLSFLALADLPVMLYVFAAVYGFAHGGFFTVVSPTVADYFGMRAHGAIFGAVVFSGTIGAAIGPMAAGRVFDLTHTYAPAFWGLAALSLLGLSLIASLPKPARSAAPERQRNGNRHHGGV